MLLQKFPPTFRHFKARVAFVLIIDLTDLGNRIEVSDDERGLKRLSLLDRPPADFLDHAMDVTVSEIEHSKT